MPLLVACWRLSRLMRHCFLGRWIWINFPSQSPILQMAKSPNPHYNRAFCILYGWYDTDTGACSSFTNSSQHIDSLIWAKEFELWFTSLYSTALLFILCVPWSTGDFWHCFDSSTVVSWPQFCSIGQLHRVFSSQLMLTHFSWYWFNCAVILEQSTFCHASWWLMKLSSA